MSKKIQLLVFDVDGTLSDGKVYYSQSGEETKAFDIRDGLAIAVWNKESWRHSAIITGRTSPIVEQRAKELGIEHIFMGVKDKGAVLEGLLQNLGLDSEAVACIGDDLNDIAMFKLCKRAYMPHNGAKALQKYAHKVLSHNGGDGAVREMIEEILESNGEKSLEEYFL